MVRHGFMQRRLGEALAAGLGVLLLAGGRAAVAAEWRTYENCRLVASEYHDGDSFHVKRGRRTEIFRLYFVDAPESDITLEDRIAEQAEYFDVSPERVQELAEEAKRFAGEFLTPGFTVESLREDARGNSSKPRYFAMVRKGEADLGLALVEAGLARIYGVMRELPDGTSVEKHRARLRAAERRAQREKRGAWAPETRKPAAQIQGKPVTPRDLVLVQPLAVYSVSGHGRVGVLKAGTAVSILGAEGPTHYRIRFRQGEKTYEAKCRRIELGVTP